VQGTASLGRRCDKLYSHILAWLADEDLESLLVALYTTATTHDADTLSDDLADRVLEALHKHHEIDLLQPMARQGAGSSIPAVLAMRRVAWLRKLLDQQRVQANAR
jgi:hypothetical protein